MKLKLFDYHLPKNLIAQKPIRPRDNSRLMVLNRSKKSITHDFFYNLDKYLIPGDILVANNSKVIPARITGQKPTGGKIEILLLKPLSGKNYEIMVKGKIKENLEIQFSKKLKGKIKRRLSEQTWLIEFTLLDFTKNKPTPQGLINLNQFKKQLIEQIYKIGQTPTPPYIKRFSNLKEYQTIYACHKGSAAAPTAGFHFTKNLIKKLKHKKINLEFITLHVGLGTFQPVRTENITEHQIHSEWAEISKQTAERLNKAKKAKRRIIAVGTTTTRALEGFTKNNKINSGQKWVKLFIYPGYEFKFIDTLITNFHLPKSSLLIMVSAFAGRELINKAYQEAIKKKYRFYSFGDAMLII